MPSRFRTLVQIGSVVVLVSTALAAFCRNRPRGSDFPKHESVALAKPEETNLGGQFVQRGAPAPGRFGISHSERQGRMDFERVHK